MNPKILSKLKEYFIEKKGVLVVYLFGSASGKSHGWKKRPDLDIAILLDDYTLKDGSLKQQCIFWAELVALLKRDDIDVLILNTAPLILRHEVIKNGLILFEKEPSSRIDFEVSSELKFYDFKPYHQLFWETLVRRIEEGDFGNRKQ